MPILHLAGELPPARLAAEAAGRHRYQSDVMLLGPPSCRCHKTALAPEGFARGSAPCPTHGEPVDGRRLTSRPSIRARLAAVQADRARRLAECQCGATVDAGTDARGYTKVAVVRTCAYHVLSGIRAEEQRIRAARSQRARHAKPVTAARALVTQDRPVRGRADVRPTTADQREAAVSALLRAQAERLIALVEQGITRYVAGLDDLILGFGRTALEAVCVAYAEADMQDIDFAALTVYPIRDAPD